MGALSLPSPCQKLSWPVTTRLWSKGLHPVWQEGDMRLLQNYRAPILSRKTPKTVTVQVDAIVACHCATSCAFPHHKTFAPQSCRKQGLPRQSPGRYSWRSCPRTRLRILPPAPPPGQRRRQNPKHTTITVALAPAAVVTILGGSPPTRTDVVRGWTAIVE